MADGTGSGLFPHHAAELKASGVSDDVINARGYRSADKKTQLAQRGFTSTQQLVPAIVLPLYGPTGELAGYQAKPDTPRVSTKSGKPIKYETPGGSRPALDVHPFARPHIGDPNRPLFIVEGVKKGDALVTHGLCAIALSGVWSWRGRNDADGLTALAEWEYIALKNRRGIIVFDSDVSTKAPVHEAMRRLRAFLEHRGASVEIVYLPAGEGGTKVGVDDFLVAGNSVDDLLALATSELRPPPEVAEAERERQEQEAAMEAFLADFPDEPGHRLLDDLTTFIRRYIAFPNPYHASVVALWALLTHVYTIFDSTPRLAVVSPEKGSGKTRVLEVLEGIVRVPLRTENMSVAALFRSVENLAPTILLDEIDTVFGAAAVGNEDLRGLINAGHRKGASVFRCVGDSQEVVSFAVFAPVALAGIGRLPDTIADRSIFIRLRRRAPGEKVEPFRFRKATPLAHALRDRCQAWAIRHAGALADTEPDMPAGVNDRPADVWEPLFAVADAAGGVWPKKARDAAADLLGSSKEDDDQSLGARLLADIHGVFKEANHPERMSSKSLVEALKEHEDGFWDDQDPRLTQSRLASLLKGYGIKSKSIRFGTKVPRGYERSWFFDAWARYLSPPPTCCATPATPPQNHPSPAETSVASPNGVAAHGATPDDGCTLGHNTDTNRYKQKSRSEAEKGSVAPVAQQQRGSKTRAWVSHVDDVIIRRPGQVDDADGTPS